MNRDNVKIVKWSDLFEPKLSAINLELTNHCNLACDFCMNKLPIFRAKGSMKQELIQRVYDELPSYIALHICGIGEPCLHPYFQQTIELLGNKFDDISIVTNGMLFNSDENIKILDGRVKKIFLSLDYINEIEYAKRKGGSLNKVLNGIRKFNELRKDFDTKIILQVNYLIEKEKYDYMAAINQINELLQGDCEIYFRAIKNLAGQIAIKLPNHTNVSNLRTDLSWIKNVTFENWDSLLKQTNFSSDKPKICRHIYYYYMLLWNGDVVPCCNDFNSNQKILNVYDKKDLSLEQIFYGQEFNAFRKKMEGLDYTGDQGMCARCSDYYKA